MWGQVLAQVSQTNPALAGILTGSAAYEAGDLLLIDSPITLFGQMIKQEGFVTVSYTHLDVYKRQEYPHAFRFGYILWPPGLPAGSGEDQTENS